MQETSLACPGIAGSTCACKRSKPKEQQDMQDADEEGEEEEEEEDCHEDMATDIGRRTWQQTSATDIGIGLLVL